MQNYLYGTTILYQDAISQILLDPKVYSTLKLDPPYIITLVQVCHLTFLLSAFLYKIYIDRKRSENQRKSLMNTVVNSFSNVANVKLCFAITLIIFMATFFQSYFSLFDSRPSFSFFWTLSVVVILLAVEFPFGINIAQR